MIYEAVCSKCKRVHVYHQPVDKRNKTPICCGMKTVRKIITPPMATIIGPAAG